VGVKIQKPPPPSRGTMIANPTSSGKPTTTSGTNTPLKTCGGKIISDHSGKISHNKIIIFGKNDLI